MQIEDCQKSVEIQNPYTPTRILSIAHSLIEHSSFSSEGCREWKRKPMAEKTWDNCKIFFAYEFKESCESK